MHDTLQWRLQVPADAPVRLVEDIETYSALVEMQSKMTGTSSWFAKLC